MEKIIQESPLAICPDLVERPSRGAIKRHLEQFDKLARLVVNLPSGRYDKLVFPEPLKRALDEARRLTAYGAIKRQLQLVATIMEQFDTLDIEMQLKKMDHKKPAPKPALSKEIHDRITGLLALDESSLYQTLQETHSIEQLNNLRREFRVAKKDLEKGADPTKVYKILSQALN